MVILALDTTTRGGSVALWRDGAIDERPGDADRTHAARLPGDLAAIVTANGLRLDEVDVYAVLTGPGSFTGMRVGIATMQALALVHGRQVFGLSALDALAEASIRSGLATPAAIVCAAMDAYRGEVFGRVYEVTAGEGNQRAEPLGPPQVDTPANLASNWRSIVEARPAGTACVVFGDAVPHHRLAFSSILGGHAELHDAPLLAGVLAARAAREPEAFVAPHAVVPLYVRRPDAELARDRKTADGAVDAPRPANA